MTNKREWTKLLLEAKRLGISAEEVSQFLKGVTKMEESRAYEISYLKNGEVRETVVVADWYQEAREQLKKQHKQKIEILGWRRSYGK